MFPSQQTRQSRGAFTLVEVLVVVGVLAVLMALAVPSLKNARNKGQQTQCMNNLKNIYVGFRLYATDNNDKIPLGYDVSSNQMYPTKIGPYLNNGTWQWSAQSNCKPYFVCPAQNLAKAQWYWGSYMMNVNVCHGGPFTFSKFSDQMTKTLFLFDAVTAGQANSPSAIVMRHSSGANLLFLDGHGEWRGSTNMDAAGTGFWIGQ
jgi:prepilin-type processing-associated H-X9-DG protein/prepilin-type N-terminal cleavage/methylation domain-containing protein